MDGNAQPSESPAQRIDRKVRNRMRAYAIYRTQFPHHTYQDFAHAKLPIHPHHLAHAARTAGLPEKVASRVEHCCDAAALWQDSTTGLLATKSNTCKRRICPLCAGSVLRRRKEKLLSALPPNVHRLKFITLTTEQAPYTEQSLKSSIRRLRNSFIRLQKNPIWSNNVRAGLYVLETKPSGTYEHCWHTHLHIIADCNFIPIDRLNQAWCKAARCQASATVQTVRRRSDAIHYISSYLSKACNADVYQDERYLHEFLQAMAGPVRLCAFFGAWHRTKEERVEIAKSDAPGHFALKDTHHCLGLIDFLIDSACRGNSRDADVLEAVGYGRNLPARLFQMGVADERPPPPIPSLSSLWEHAA